MFTPRNYQINGHNDTLNYLDSKKGLKPGLVIFPTGTGKSLSIAMVTNEYKVGKALILSPSQEILDQNYKKYLTFGGEASIYSASFKSKEMGDVTYATLGSIKNLGKVFKDFGVTLLILDEAHLNTDAQKGMFRTFFDELNPKHTLGYTATPFRLKNYQDMGGFSYSQLTLLNRSRPKFFSNIVHVTQIPDVVRDGFWAPVQAYMEDFNPLGLTLNSSGSEFNETSMKRVMKNNNTNNKVYLKTKEVLKDGFQSILLFLDTVESCYTMVMALGPKSAVIEAKTKTKERKDIIAKFKSGEINVICCVSTLTTGFDFPELQVVMMGRPTNSLAVFYQIYGRLVRPFEGKIGQFYDFCGNIERFGRMEDMVFEDYKDHGWALFSGENLLTGTPMGIPPTTKTELDNMEKIDFAPGTSKVFKFGKYANVDIDEVPLHYIKWALENTRSNMTLPLIELCTKKMTLL